MKVRLSLAIVAALALSATAAAHGKPPPRCPQARVAINHYQDVTHRWQARSGHASTPTGIVWPNAGCSYLRWLQHRWWQRARHAHSGYLARMTIPMTTNWTRAMRYAQRPFPGTYEWLEAISGRECRACYTTAAFICNYQGSGACGPMQFMRGTYYGHADDARAWLAAHHYVVHPSAWSWRSQLGQALTAGYMRYTGQDGCHWCLG